MTKLPTESHDIIGLTGPEYKVGPYCAAPGCHRVAEHAHHIVRRSYLNGPYSWVKMPDGVEVGNLTGLCVAHHEQVTNNKANIIWGKRIYSNTGDVDTINKYLWEEGNSTIPLTIQPPLLEHAEETLTEAEAHTRPVCPGCGRPLPKPKPDTPKEEAKPRGTWAVSVPMEERENGADVLDELLDAARDELDKAGISYGKGNRVKYYQLATALALFVQHASEVLSDA